MRSFAVLLLFLLSGGFARADYSDAICTDLYKATCRPGTRSDVTGTKYSSAEASDRVEKIESELSQSLKPKIKKFLTNEDNAYLRQILIGNLDLDEDECDAHPQDCESAIEQGLYAHMRHGFFPTKDIVFKAGQEKLADLKALEVNEAYMKFVRDFDTEAMNKLVTPEMEAKARSVFDKIKLQMVERLESMNIDERTRKKMIIKIRDVKYHDVECAPTAAEPAWVPNASYNREGNRMDVCASFLMHTTSEFHLAMLLGHELSHAIDPNLIADANGAVFGYDLRKPLDPQYPIHNVLSCLRGSRSVQAHIVGGYNYSAVGSANPTPPPAPPPNQTKDYGPFGPGRYPAPVAPGPGVPQNPLPNSAPPGAPVNSFPQPTAADFYGQDQIGESFSDWMGAELASRYMEKEHPGLTAQQYRDGYANAFTFLCRKLTVQPTDLHPPDDLRVNAVILQNPLIRKQMGCPAHHPKYEYCDESKAWVADKPANDHSQVAWPLAPETQR